MDQSQSRQIGPHTISYAAPDLIFMSLRGEMTQTAIVELIDETYAIMARHGHTFALVDVTQLRQLSHEVRRVAHKELARRSPYRGSSALFGASTPIRLLMTFLMNAVRLVTGRGTEEISFFKDREEALNWLLGRRLALTGNAAPIRSPSGEAPPLA